MLKSYIYTFLKVADLGSFSKAAEELYISKVSIMNQINSLEERVGVNLFDRSNKGVTLTEAGRLFYRKSKELLDFSNNLLNELKLFSKNNVNTIRIGTSIMRPYNNLIDIWESIPQKKNINLILFLLTIMMLVFMIY